VADRTDQNAPAASPAASATLSGDRTGGGGTATGGTEQGSSGGAQGGYGGTGSIGSAGGVGSHELWTEYGAVLQRACEKFKFYPPVAVARRWQGEAEVQIDRSVDGAVTLSIRRSAGRKVLDDAALEIVRKGMAELPIPEKFRSRALVLYIIIRFRITD
jgi:TonB family protein